MSKSILWIFGVLLFSASVGPLTFVTTQSGRADAADLYLVVNGASKTDLKKDMYEFGTLEIGPEQGLLSRLILTPHKRTPVYCNQGTFCCLQAPSLHSVASK